MGVNVLLEVPIVGLMVPRGWVVAVGPNPKFAAGPVGRTGTLPVCVTVGPSNLCKGRSVHPSGIVTPGGRSALPAGMAAVFRRTPYLCI